MSDKAQLGTALITGASTGIGAVYADRLAKRGYDLVLAARDEARLEALAARLRAETGVAVEVVKADVTVRTDLAGLEARLRNDDRVTLLVNNAGASLNGTFAEADPDGLENLIQLNIIALTRLANAAAAAFAPRGRGTIVNLGSVIGLMPEFRNVVYGATKAYVLYLTQAINEELAGSGVRLQAVLPGATRTEIWDRSGKGLASVDPNILMDVDELVDAALAGLDQGELVTIPSLADPADWSTFQAARLKLAPNLSHRHPAERYGVALASA
ncbi:MAG: family NAD(P)-dependent oxidoreductase [Phenylobacterium sp.]|nr:family NAD(P)-dependent oxidoreductase [Phenylobacterium sp.]